MKLGLAQNNSFVTEMLEQRKEGVIFLKWVKTWEKNRKVRDEVSLKYKEDEQLIKAGEDVNIVEEASGNKCIEEGC